MSSNTNTKWLSRTHQSVNVQVQYRSQGNKFIQAPFPFQHVLSYIGFSCSHPRGPCCAEQVWYHEEPCRCRGSMRHQSLYHRLSHMQMSPWEVEWLVQSPQQHRCASSRAPTARWRPRRSSRKLSAITQTPSYHCGPAHPSERAAKFSVFAKTPRWILAAARLFLLHQPLWHKPLLCSALHLHAYPKELCRMVLHIDLSYPVS